MAKSVRVPIHRTSPTQTVQVEVGATVGAQIGVNLLGPDGELVRWDQIANSEAGGGDSGSITTTDDLEEGQWNLWFTDRRAQDAVGGILADTATIDLAYTAGTSITATLKDLADSGTGTALVKITRDAKGRVSDTSAATTTDLAEGTNLYFTDARVRATALTGLSTATATPVTSTDSVLVGVGKLQGQASAAATAIAGKEPSITPGTTAQYWRGDKTWRDFATDVRAAVLTGLSTATSAAIAATDTVLAAFGKLQAQITNNLLPKGYIEGLDLNWVSGNSISARSGAAYIEGLGRVLRVDSSITASSLSLSAWTIHHVYLYSDAGTPGIEVVTTAPDAPYIGAARSKIGDTSRRYLGDVVTDGSGAIYNFINRYGRVIYRVATSSSPFRVLSSGVSTTETNVSCAAVIPATARVATVRIVNNTPSVAVFGTSDDSLALSGGTFMLRVPNGEAYPDIALDSSQRFSYLVNDGSSGGLFVDIRGYQFER